MEKVMSKSVSAQKESGAHQLPKGHLKPEKESGPHHNKAKGHELPSKSEGRHDVGKPTTPREVDGQFHSGRALPKATRLSDSKILKGHVEKRDNV